MLEGIDVTALRAIPGSLLRVGIAGMNHLDNQVAVQAHRWFAVYELRLCSFWHDSHLFHPNA
jgi:hypothetical protein